MGVVTASSFAWRHQPVTCRWPLLSRRRARAPEISAGGTGVQLLAVLPMCCCSQRYVLLPAIPTTGLLSVMDPVEPQKKASP